MSSAKPNQLFCILWQYIPKMEYNTLSGDKSETGSMEDQPSTCEGSQEPLIRRNETADASTTTDNDSRTDIDPGFHDFSKNIFLFQFCTEFKLAINPKLALRVLAV